MISVTSSGSLERSLRATVNANVFLYVSKAVKVKVSRAEHLIEHLPGSPPLILTYYPNLTLHK